MSNERELGGIVEQLKNLNERQDREFKSIHAKFDKQDAKLDEHIKHFHDWKLKVAKLSGTVSVVVSGLLLFVKKALAFVTGH